MVWADQATSHYLNQWWCDCRLIYASFGLNKCVCKLDRHWLRKWPVHSSVPSHALRYECWIIVNWTLIQEQISVKFWMIFKHLHSRKCIWKCRLQNVGHFVSVWICQAQIEICALKHRGLKKWPEFCRAYFQMLFVKWKLYRLFQIFWVCSRVTNFVTDSIDYVWLDIE